MTLEHHGLRHALARSPDQARREERHVWLRTAAGVEIEGLIHVPPGLRTLDFLNRPGEAFIAVTMAMVRAEGQVTRSEFVAVNKTHIVVLREAASRL